MFNILYDSGFLLEISIYLYHCFLPTSTAMLTEYSIDNKALLLYLAYGQGAETQRIRWVDLSYATCI